MTSFFDNRVCSSYGPHGRSKVLIAHAGVVLVTKDCSQLLQHTACTDSLSKLFLSIIKRHADTYGDGGMTLTLLLSSCIEYFDSYLGRDDHSTMRFRLKTLRCVDSILTSIHKIKDTFSSYLVQSGLWFSYDFNIESMGLLCNHILYPTSNTEVAHNLASIVVFYFVIVQLVSN